MMPDQNGIYITKKQASITAALLVVLSLLLFVAGYFWGKHSVIDGFSQRTSQESFNDQVDYLLTMQSFAAKNGGTFPSESTESKEQDVENLLQNLPDALEENDSEKLETQPSIKPTPTSVPSVKAAKLPEPKVEVNSVAKPEASASKTGKHYAVLAGFAKKPSAMQLVQRLKKRHIDVEIKTRTSKSASGKAHKTWYQVVTVNCDSVQDVESVVDKILMSEKIKRSDIKIV